MKDLFREEDRRRPGCLVYSAVNRIPVTMMAVNKGERSAMVRPLTAVRMLGALHSWTRIFPRQQLAVNTSSYSTLS